MSASQSQISVKGLLALSGPGFWVCVCVWGGGGGALRPASSVSQLPF